MLTDEDVRFFRENGYLLPHRQLFAPEKLERLEAVFNEHLAAKGEKLSDTSVKYTIETENLSVQKVFTIDPPNYLVRMAVTEGRRTRKDLKVGICGEHGGDPESVAFCHEVGLDYVSCSPFRVPIARLAAAQAAIRSKPARGR